MAGSDPRLTVARPDLAAASLRGLVDADRYVTGRPAMVTVPLADLRDRPDAPALSSQLRAGAMVTVYEEDESTGMAWVQAGADSYVGYLDRTALGVPVEPTHIVHVRQTHAYPEANMKRRPALALSLGAAVTVVGEEGDFLRTGFGHVPRQHLAPMGALPDSDPVTVAERLVGTPYLWGGTSAFGIDCSGLVQLALAMVGRDGPRDADQQEAAVGVRLDPDAPLRRGDLVFWRGHVGWMADDRTLLHANAHAMAVSFEPLRDAMARIRDAGEGDVTAVRRP
ncbi:C40 family peptidase [Oceanomicrobium pacificus]|uniref:NlpC/P60 domain-containing protein n=1 Tax=Oceanomicrobium pacificus TaxID=2692916 RepID=A0A6B0TS80_9RHOB|nr:C40 family peptidase [Oceanomicrobium pacificus]MXU64588.1 hypothetical protein [Oceanomicrobium pacificus]